MASGRAHHDVEVALLVDARDVPRVEPAVVVDVVEGGLAVVPVLLHEADAAALQEARGVDGQLRAVLAAT